MSARVCNEINVINVFSVISEPVVLMLKFSLVFNIGGGVG